MSQRISLKEAERKAFRFAFQDGLWDIFIGCVILLFAIAPLLSSTLGDLWSSVVFLPFWALVFLAIWLIKKHVVAPRVGSVKFGSSRRTRLTRFTVVMLGLNVVAFILGILASRSIGPDWIARQAFWFFILAGFSIAAYFLNFTRLYVYGLLVALSPLAGEWLYVNAKASHHGFPITFGITAGVIILIGLVQFARLLRDHPIATDQPASGEAIE